MGLKSQSDINAAYQIIRPQIIDWGKIDIDQDRLEHLKKQYGEGTFTTYHDTNIVDESIANTIEQRINRGKITKLWLEGYGPERAFFPHVHWNSSTTGLLYLDNIGGTIFFTMSIPKGTAEHLIKSETNKLITFNPLAIHYVDPHGQQGITRRSIAFMIHE